MSGWYRKVPRYPENPVPLEERLRKGLEERGLEPIKTNSLLPNVDLNKVARDFDKAGQPQKGVKVKDN